MSSGSLRNGSRQPTDGRSRGLCKCGLACKWALAVAWVQESWALDEIGLRHLGLDIWVFGLMGWARNTKKIKLNINT